MSQVMKQNGLGERALRKPTEYCVVLFSYYTSVQPHGIITLRESHIVAIYEYGLNMLPKISCGELGS